MAAAACSRDNLQLLLATRDDINKLAAVEACLREHPDPRRQAISLVRGLRVRLRHGQYHLALVERLVRQPGADAMLHVQLPLEQGPEAKAVPLNSVSGTNPLDEQHWLPAGQQEVERLAAHMRQHGGTMPLTEAAAAAWRKHTALEWHGQHGQAPREEQQQYLPALVQQLHSADGIAAMQQRFVAVQPAGFTIHLPEQPAAAAAAVAAAAPPPSPPAAAAAAAAPPAAAAAAAAASPPQQQQQALPMQQPAANGHVAASHEGPEARCRASSDSPASGRPGSSRLPAFCMAVLPGCYSRDGALRALAPAIRAAARSVGRFEACQQALLAGLLRQGLQPYGKVEGGFRQYTLPTSKALTLMAEASSADRAVRSEYERRRLPLLFDDLAERGLLDTHSPGRGGEATELLLRVDRLWKEFGAQGQRGTTGRGRSRSRSGGREARRSASPPQRKRRRSRSASPLRRGRRRSRSRSAEWRRPAAEPGREPLLAPVRLQQYRPHAAPGEAPVRDEWVLTGPVVMITGLPSGTSVVDVERLIGDAGGTVVECRVMARPEHKHGDSAWPTLQTAAQAAAIIQRLQGLPMGGRHLCLHPCKGEVERLLRHPRAAEEGKRALAAAQGRSAGQGGSGARGSERRRSRSRSRSRGRQHGARPRSASAEPRSQAAARGLEVLAPLRLVQYRVDAAEDGAPLQDSWELIGRQVFISGLPSGATWAGVRELLRSEARGGTVVEGRVVYSQGGDRRGTAAVATFAAASQAAAVVEQLQGTRLEGRRLYLRPYEQEVSAACKADPQAAAAAYAALAAAKAAAERRRSSRQGARSRSRSRSRSRRAGPAATQGQDLLLPVLFRRYRLGAAAGEAPMRQAWELVGREVFVSGLPHDSTQADVKKLLRGGGGTVLSVMMVQSDPGDRRGAAAVVTLAATRQAAALVEQLQGTEVQGRRLFMRPSKFEADELCRANPAVEAAAKAALEAARAGAWPPSSSGQGRPDAQLARHRSRSRSRGRQQEQNGARDASRSRSPAGSSEVASRDLRSLRIRISNRSQSGSPGRSASLGTPARSGQEGSAGAEGGAGGAGGSQTPPRSPDPTASTGAS